MEMFAALGIALAIVAIWAYKSTHHHPHTKKSP